MTTPATTPASVRPRLAVRLTPDGLRQVRGGHPWVFDRSIRSVSHAGQPGDLAVVFDDRRRFVAIGLWDPSSPIRIRVLHHGAPLPVDEAFWRSRIDTSLERRVGLAVGNDTTAYRLIHGENDGFGGLVVDRYDTVGVVKVYSEAWVPHIATVAELVAEAVGLDQVVVRWSRQLRSSPTVWSAPWDEGDALLGAEVTGPVSFRESGFDLEADLVRGHKTGYFLDQRDNRRLVGSVATGRTVLDVFACSGGFSLAAAAGGATAVTSVDISQPALDSAVANLARNRALGGVASCRHDIRCGDAFDIMADLATTRHRYGLVVVDPPSFASSVSQVPDARRAYRRLVGLSLDLVEPGGLVFLASCSSRIGADEFHALVGEVAAARGIELQIQARTAHAVDHPIGFPEGAYLKAVLARVPPRAGVTGAPSDRI